MQTSCYTIFSPICHIVPMEKDVAFHLNQFESPVAKDALCQVQLKNKTTSSREEYFKMSSMYCLYYLPLETGVAFDLNKLESSSCKYAFTSLIITGPMHLEKKFYKVLSVFQPLLSPFKKGHGTSLGLNLAEKSTLWKLL